MPISAKMQELLLAGKLDEVEPLLRSHVKQHPQDRTVHLLWARVLLGLRRLQEAAPIVETLASAAPEDAETLSLLGLQHELYGRLDQARTAYQASLQKDPQQSNVLYNLGRLLVTSAEFSDEIAKQAEAYLRAALKLSPDHFQATFQLAALYTRTQRPEEAAQACLDTIERNPMHIPSYLFLGEVFSFLGQDDDVIELYKAGLRVNPLAHAFRDELIRLYRKKQRYEAAFQTAMEQAEMRGACEDFLEVGQLALLLGQPQTAEIAFLKAQDVSPQDWRPPFNLGELFRGAGLLDKALEAYQLSLSLAETVEGLTGVGLVQQHTTGPDHLNQAIASFQRAFHLAPGSSVCLLNLALALHQAGNKKDIATTLSRVEPLFAPDDANLAKVRALL